MAEHGPTGPARGRLNTTVIEIPLNNSELQSPSLHHDLDLLRRQYQNLEFHLAPLPPELRSGATLALPSQLQSSPEQILASYYLNQTRNYDINFEYKILLYQRASAAMLNIETTRSDKIFTALRQLNTDEIKAFSEIYREYYKNDFNSHVANTLKEGTPEYRHFETLLKGDRIESYASELNLRLSASSTDKEQLKILISELDIKTFEEVKAALKQKYNLELPKDLSPEAFRLEELKFHLNNAAVEPDKLIQFLRDYPKEELGLLAEKLKHEIQNTPSEIREIVKTFVEGNRPLAEAIYLNNEIKDGTLTTFKLHHAFANLSQEERQKLADNYREKFEHKLYNEVRNAFSESPIDLHIAKQIVELNKVDESAKIYMLSVEASRDKPRAQELIRTLEQKSSAEISHIKQEILRAFDVNIDKHIASNLNGKTQLDARLSLYGKPDTLEDELLKRKAVHEFERLNKPFIIEKLVPGLAKKGKDADEEMRELEEHHRKIADLKENLGENDELRFYSLLNFFDKRIAAYETSKRRYFRFIENIISALSSLITYLMANDFIQSLIPTLVLSTITFFLAKSICKSYFRKNERTEKALQNFKENRRKRKKSHKSRRKALP